jgi:hypothetical protein
MFFEISERLAQKIFYPRRNEDYKYVTTTTPLEVAQDIRRVVAQEEFDIALKEWSKLDKREQQEIIVGITYSAFSAKKSSVELTYRLLKKLSESV